MAIRIRMAGIDMEILETMLTCKSFQPKPARLPINAATTAARMSGKCGSVPNTKIPVNRNSIKESTGTKEIPRLGVWFVSIDMGRD